MGCGLRAPFVGLTLISVPSPVESHQDTPPQGPQQDTPVKRGQTNSSCRPLLDKASTKHCHDRPEARDLTTDQHKAQWLCPLQTTAESGQQQPPVHSTLTCHRGRSSLQNRLGHEDAMGLVTGCSGSKSDSLPNMSQDSWPRACRRECSLRLGHPPL